LHLPLEGIGTRTGTSDQPYCQQHNQEPATRKRADHLHMRDSSALFRQFYLRSMHGSIQHTQCLMPAQQASMLYRPIAPTQVVIQGEVGDEVRVLLRSGATSKEGPKKEITETYQMRLVIAINRVAWRS
jgi:hypothetical protein